MREWILDRKQQINGHALFSQSALFAFSLITYSSVVCLSLTYSPLAHSDETIVKQPYIEKLKKQMKEDESKSDASERAFSRDQSYSEKLKENLVQQDAEKGVTVSPSSAGYSERLKKRNEEATRDDPNASSDNYSERVKQTLEPKVEESAIKEFHEGTDDLEPKIKGEIHHAFGLRYGISTTYNATANEATQALDFNSIYGSNYVPDASFLYEFQPIHSEWYGSLGIFALGGITYFHGVGQFGASLDRPDGGTFSTGSQTSFQFFVLPATVGLNYRFNLLRIFRPYFMVGPSLIGYWERRNDKGPNSVGYSKGYQVVAGVAILLDWLSTKARWDIYANQGIKHSYLTIDYSKLGSFSGGNDVFFSFHGVYLGFTFEY